MRRLRVQTGTTATCTSAPHALTHLATRNRNDASHTQHTKPLVVYPRPRTAKCSAKCEYAHARVQHPCAVCVLYRLESVRSAFPAKGNNAACVRVILWVLSKNFRWRIKKIHTSAEEHQQQQLSTIRRTRVCVWQLPLKSEINIPACTRTVFVRRAPLSRSCT